MRRNFATFHFYISLEGRTESWLRCRVIW